MDKMAAGSTFGKQSAAQALRLYSASLVFALLIFGWMATGIVSGSLARFDLESAALVHQLATPATTVLMRVASTVGAAAFLLPLFIVAATVLVISGRRKDMTRFALTMSGATLIELTLKHSFHRPRPMALFASATFSTYSFPSGHALSALCFYGQLAVLRAGRTNNKTLRVLIWSAASSLMLMIGLSRIYLGAHYTTDVIAGYAAAAAWTSALPAVQPIQRQETSLRERGNRAAPELTAQASCPRVDSIHQI
jgi:membrane-associated phospholipid phosphatase